MDCAGNGRCCFDGCIYTCTKLNPCGTVVETKYENVTRDVCELQQQAPVCTTSLHEKCGTVCETVDEVVSSPVESIVCVQKMEAVCREVFAELCVVPEVEQQFCPVIHALEASQCEGQPHSDCWSPGMTDVDCEGFGLCCFNGCFNRCLKDDRCENVTRTECVEKPSETCEDVSKNECNPMAMVVPVSVTTEVCSTSERVCATKTSEVCQEFATEKCTTETFEECSDVAVPFNDTVSEEVCRNKTVLKCDTIYEEVCVGSKANSYIGYECHTVPEEVCHPSVEAECFQVERIIEKERQETRCDPKERPVCIFEPNFECRPVELTQCTEGGVVCNTNRTNKTEELIFQVCMTVNQTVCTPNSNTECHEVSETVCPECEKKMVSSTQCSDIPREVCTKEVKYEQKVMPKEICSKVCVPERTEECRTPAPLNVCKPVIKTMSYQVEVLKC